MATDAASRQHAGMSTTLQATMQPGASYIQGRLCLPPVIFGISALGNLYRAPSDETKSAIVAGCRAATAGRTVFDGAGKYGAGLALEVLGRCLRAAGAQADDVLISNKLGWRRTLLHGSEPAFEPGAWVDIEHDAVQDISRDGILRCWEEGDNLLQAPFRAGLVSVHDPDEYLAQATTPAERRHRFADVLGAYRALADLRACGAVQAVGIGAKDWRIIREIVKEVRLDWVMLACCMTVHSHPEELIGWIDRIAQDGVSVVNSALFHGGFLTGGAFFDYQRIDPDNADGRRLIAWRDAFNVCCARHRVKPAHACIQFASSVPGITSIALNTTDPLRIPDNVAMATQPVDPALWRELAEHGLINQTLAWLR